MEYFPLGDLKENRWQLSKKYDLVELVNGVHRLTEKCRKHYDQLSYIGYLRGDIDRPIRIDKKQKTRKTSPVKSTREQVIGEILDL